jgi:hypothetical protein
MQQMTNLGVGAFALVLLCACGGTESGPPQQSMVPQKSGPAARAQNRAPLVERVVFEPAEPVPGRAIQAKVEARDPDGDPLRLTYRWTLNGRPVAEDGESLSGDALSRDDRVEVAVVASDGFLESQEAHARVAVQPSAPLINMVSFDPSEDVKPGTEVTALVDASAADDAQLRLDYRWLVNGDETRARGRSFDTTELRRGDKLQVEVTASDGDASSEPVLSTALEMANSPPKLAGIPKAERVGDAFRYQFEAKDPDGDRSLRFSLGEAPAGMTIDPIYGVATWRPTKEQAGRHVIEVAVNDNHGEGSTLRFTVDVTATETPAPGQAPPAAGQAAAPAAAPPAAPARTY